MGSGELRGKVVRSLSIPSNAQGKWFIQIRPFFEEIFKLDLNEDGKPGARCGIESKPPSKVFSAAISI